MATRPGSPAGRPEAPRWRVDGREGAAPAVDEGAGPPSSGRRAVVGLVLAVLALWLGLDLAFRGWKARYRALAEFGARAGSYQGCLGPLALQPADGAHQPGRPCTCLA